jgi:hypothetical protein
MFRVQPAAAGLVMQREACQLSDAPAGASKTCRRAAHAISIAEQFSGTLVAVTRIEVGAWATAAVLTIIAPHVRAADATPGSTSPAAQPDSTTAQSPEPQEARWDWAVFPVVFYAPETSLGIVMGAAIFDDRPRPAGEPRRDDNANIALQLTLRKQVAVSVSLTKYFEDGLYQLTEDAAVAHVPNFYWGLGNDTADSAQEPFTQSGVFSRITFAARLAESLYVGAGLSAGWYGVTGVDAGGDLENFLKSTPASGSLFGIGPVLRRDTRDDALGAHHGSLTSLSATFYPGGIGAYDYSFYELDHRGHFSIGSRSVLAFELYGVYAPGHVPIIDMPSLGGASRMRGYFQGRYRDHLYVMGQAEWRVRVYGRFSLAPFAGVGNVFPTLAALSLQDPKVAGGLSVRFSLKKERDLNVHLDVAVAPDSSGIYFNLGEAF